MGPFLLHLLQLLEDAQVLRLCVSVCVRDRFVPGPESYRHTNPAHVLMPTRPVFPYRPGPCSHAGPARVPMQAHAARGIRTSQRPGRHVPAGTSLQARPCRHVPAVTSRQARPCSHVPAGTSRQSRLGSHHTHGRRIISHLTWSHWQPPDKLSATREKDRSRLGFRLPIHLRRRRIEPDCARRLRLEAQSV